MSATKYVPTGLERWLPGAPPHVTEASLCIDALACRALRCGHCKRRGTCVPVPEHWGRRYRCFACCELCGSREEI